MVLETRGEASHDNPTIHLMWLNVQLHSSAHPPTTILRPAETEVVCGARSVHPCYNCTVNLEDVWVIGMWPKSWVFNDTMRVCGSTKTI